MQKHTIKTKFLSHINSTMFQLSDSTPQIAKINSPSKQTFFLHHLQTFPIHISCIFLLAKAKIAQRSSESSTTQNTLFSLPSPIPLNAILLRTQTTKAYITRTLLSLEGTAASAYCRRSYAGNSRNQKKNTYTQSLFLCT